MRLLLGSAMHSFFLSAGARTQPVHGAASNRVGADMACCAALRQHPRRRPLVGWQLGFTLVEVLIALSLLSLLMLVLTGALRAMGQVEERVEQRIEAVDDFRLTVQLLGDALGRVSARRHTVQAAGGPAQVPFFEAGPDVLAWIGVLPARYGLGGRHYLRLSVEMGESGASLVLRHAPWNGAPTFGDWGQAQARVLVAPVSALALRYQDPASGEWSPLWPPPGVPVNALPPSRLPAAIQLRLDGPVPAWPPVVVAVLPTRASDPAAAGAGFGGGGR